MNKIKVINKGYRLEVKSWENDGDNNKTIVNYYQDKDEALRILNLVELLGNDRQLANRYYEGDDEAFKDIVGTIKRKYHHLFDLENKNDEEIFDLIQDDLISVLGYTEYYFLRVCESAVLTYSPEDIYLERITIEK